MNLYWRNCSIIFGGKEKSIARENIFKIIEQEVDAGSNFPNSQFPPFYRSKGSQISRNFEIFSQVIVSVFQLDFME